MTDKPRTRTAELSCIWERVFKLAKNGACELFICEASTHCGGCGVGETKRGNEVYVSRCYRLNHVDACAAEPDRACISGREAPFDLLPWDLRPNPVADHPKHCCVPGRRKDEAMAIVETLGLG